MSRFVVILEYWAVLAYLWWQATDPLPIDWAALSRLVPEVILVLVFMLYTRERDRTFLSSQEKRDSEWRDFLKEERAVREKMQKEERDNRIEMIKEERQARSESASRLAEEMKAMGQVLASTQALLVQHDAYTRCLE